MRTAVLIGVGGLAGAVAVGGRRCRRDIAAARTRVEQVPCAVVRSRFGDVEYADVGSGAAVLVVHGIFGGRDAGLASLGELLPDRRAIAPSRFGYLGSSMPPDATPALQADAYADLLDALGIGRVDVIAFSAGSVSALQFVLRHGERAHRLVVMSGDWPGPTAVAPPAIVKVVYRSDAVMWSVRRLAGRALLRFIAGVPPDFPMSATDRAQVSSFVDTIFPVRERSSGIIFDAYVGNPDVNAYPLEAVRVPTLVIHSQDDTMASYEAARSAASRIPGARLVSHPHGGHLMVGQDEATEAAVRAFLGTVDHGVDPSPTDGAG